MSRMTQIGWMAAFWIFAAAPALAAAPPPASCQAASAASAPDTRCPERPVPPVQRPAAATPGISQQVTLYCGATAPALASSAAAAEVACKKAAEAESNKLNVKLPGGIGLDFQSNNASLSYLFVVLAVLLVAFALWRAAGKATDGETSVTATLVIFGLVVFGLGGLLGYWWKGDRVTTLAEPEVRKLVENQGFARDLQRALADNAQAVEERGQLKAKLAAAEQDLAVERAKSGGSGSNGSADWMALFIGLVTGAAGMAWSWYLARARNIRLESAVEAAHNALSADASEKEERSLSSELDGLRQRVRLATGLLARVRHAFD